MPGFCRRPLAVFVCCLFVGAQSSHAADDILHLRLASLGNGGEAQAVSEVMQLAALDVPLRLRTERRFNVLGKKRNVPTPVVVGIELPAALQKDDTYPLFITADQIEGQTDDLTVAEGNVEMRKTGSLVLADRMTYRMLDDEIEAFGSVRVLQDGAEINTPHFRMKLDEQLGSAEKVSYQILKETKSRFYSPTQTVVTVASSNANTSGAPMMLNVANSYGLPTQSPPQRPTEANGRAERVDFEGENQYTFWSNSFSTCKPGREDWYLNTAETHLDYDRNEGTASHASLWFGGVPIFYSPVVSFALNGEHRSGLLHPHFSISSRSGFDFTQPYYWNIAPDYDLTLYPRYMSKRGFQLGAEARYLQHNFQGMTRVEYLPNDEVLNRQRYGYRIEHVHNLGRGVSAAVNLNGVSDDFYWQDMSSRLLQTSLTQLPRQVALNYSPSPWLQSSMQVLRYQTLQLDPTAPVARPYFLEPQINVIGYRPNVLHTDLSMIGQYSRFTHVDVAKDQGDRIVFYPQVSVPFVNPAFQITPKFGLHMSKYALDRRDPASTGFPDTISRALPTFTLDSTVIFEREGDWFGKGYIQTLEPRLYYVNIPYRDQSKIPLFDTGLSDFNFAQIFSENRYSGYDRINDANQLTAAVTTRLLDGETGVERFKAMVGQRSYFKPQQVSIAGEVVRTANTSNLVAAVNGLIAPKTYSDVAWEYNYHDNLSERFSAGVRFQPELGKVLSASYRYTRNPLTTTSTVDQIDMAGQWPLSSKWYVVGRYNYSLRDKKTLESIAGVEYNAGCWAVRVVGQRLAAISGAPNDTLFFQLELNDFGSIGTNPIGLLRRSIPGYGKINELPNSDLLGN
ncbi:LPS-assembly protein LptD [Dechloromonas sp. HYN0024]|uniref:LPS-assembly protein LptD n=1 Tax=Dechloromonas sp. HYN0024 TaxID=2231055 RepID=UPI000E4411FC|nr:LPS-assembly protein LptD [Dechloromonas sp. HYN0024]AXS80932.1 LPS-assembly protein LptD [Dechloromonas sp. HYN0024]